VISKTSFWLNGNPITGNIEEAAMSAYISSIHIQNFKSLIGPVDIDLKPLTFFYGPNSAGKSAITAAIDLVHQFCVTGEPDDFKKLRMIVRNQDPQNLLSLGLTVSYDRHHYLQEFNEFNSLFNDFHAYFEDLFSYFRRNQAANYEISNSAKDENFDSVFDVGVMFYIQSEEFYSPDAPWVSLIEKVGRDLDHLVLLEKIDWIVEIRVGSDVLVIFTEDILIFNHDHELFFLINRILAHENLSFLDLLVFFEVSQVGNFLGLVPEHYFSNGLFHLTNYDPTHDNSFADSSAGTKWNLIKDLAQFLVMVPLKICISGIRSSIYLGPIRAIPDPRELTFLARVGESNDKIWNGWHNIYATTKSSNPQWNWYDGSAAWKEIAKFAPECNELLSSVNDWLVSHQRLGLRHRILVTVYATHEMIDSDFGKGDLTEIIESIPDRIILIRLRDDVMKMPVNVQGVGAGVPQIIPVLVAGLVADCSFIQQPELHLHPRLQTEIADFFISVTNTRNHKCIIETHSEHLALRTLRRVRETHSAHIRHRDFSLENESVAFYYFNPVEGGTEITRLRVSPEGDFLDRWPRGFFSEREAEIFDDDD